MKQVIILSLFWSFLFCNFLLRCSFAQDNGYVEIEVKNGGIVTGNVSYIGSKGAPSLDLYTRWEIPASTPSISKKLEVSSINNGLKNAVVSIVDIKKGKKRKIPVIHPVIDQQENVFIPRVTPVIAGTTIDILNGDEEMHNIHTRSIRNQPFNLGTTYKQRISKKFDYPEIIKLSCDIHKDSYAWIIIFEHPYFDLTNENGYFEICDIPEGTYTFQVWHEELGKQEKEVMIKAKKIEHVEFIYGPN